MLVSVVQQCEPAVCLYTPFLCEPPSHPHQLTPLGHPISLFYPPEVLLLDKILFLFHVINSSSYFFEEINIVDI